MPAQAAGGEGLELGGFTAPQLHLQHLAGLVVGRPGEAVGLQGAAVPSLGRNLLEPMPIAQGDVIDGAEPGAIEAQSVVGAGGVVGGARGIEILGAKTLHGSVGDHEPGFASGQPIPIHLVEPVAGVHAVAAPEQGAGQHHEGIQLHNLALEQHLQVGGAAALLRLEKGAVPHRAWGPMVVVAGDHQHGAGDGANGSADAAHIRAAGGGGIKQIPGYHHELHRLLAGVVGQPTYRFEAHLAQPGPLIRIQHPGIGLADLPIGAVQQPDGRGSSQNWLSN